MRSGETMHRFIQIPSQALFIFTMMTNIKSHWLEIILLSFILMHSVNYIKENRLISLSFKIYD